MSNVYTIYNKELAPEALTSHYPKAAQYFDDNLANSITVYLFADTLEDITGTPAETIIDIASLGFNYPFTEEGEGLTEAELNAMVDNLLTTTQLGSECQLSFSQGRYLHSTRFKANSTE